MLLRRFADRLSRMLGHSTKKEMADAAVSSKMVTHNLKRGIESLKEATNNLSMRPPLPTLHD